MQLFDPFLYEKIHLLIVLGITFYVFFIFQSKKADAILNRKRLLAFVFVYLLVFTIVVGFRPVSHAFTDTVNYANGYQVFSKSPVYEAVSTDTLFYLLMWWCSQYMSVHWFFFIVELLYIVPIVIACYLLLMNNVDIGIVFVIAAFSFFSYGVNGLRNGVALSFVFLAISLIQGNYVNKILCAVISLLAISFHASASLPVICMLVAYLIKKPGFFFYFWGFSILISLIAGNSVANLFASLGFDDRISDYIHPDIDEDLYTRTGFRWDFLLYSAAPIILGWYVIFKRKVINSTYLLLLGTYILSNSFWIMVIRAEFSNRFAYLSWFLYPIVIAYPLLRLKIWPKTQGRKTAIIMACHLAFTMLMVFVF